MPIYEYRCRKCGNESEQLVFGSGSDVRCPECGGADMEKLMSPTSSMTGNTTGKLPGHGDTGCCGFTPGMAEGCEGPGSCCGKA